MSKRGFTTPKAGRVLVLNPCTISSSRESSENYRRVLLRWRRRARFAIILELRFLRGETLTLLQCRRPTIPRTGKVAYVQKSVSREAVRF
jgi:hypothetical protein